MFIAFADIASATDFNNITAINIWDRIVQVIITVVSIVVILAIGWVIAVVIGKIVRGILDLLNVDKIWSRYGMGDKAKMKVSLARVGEEFVKWVIILLALIAATDYAGLNQVAQFLNQVLNYIPNVIVAIIIFAIGILIADFAYTLIKGGFQTAGIGYSELVADVAKAIVLIFVILTAIEQLGIKLEFIGILFTGLVAMLAIAGGLAFGLGGQGVAKDVLEKLRSGMREK